ncbi:MAG TPA: ECF transporter S component [Atribacterota bacterium]|nr:ECF transporter S component [Atribacterota bacterium]
MTTRNIAYYSIFIALAVISGYLIHFPILPQAPFLLYDPGHVFLLIAAFKFGPQAGTIMTLVYALVFALITGQGGPYGALMNFLSTSAFVIVSSWIYLKKHDRNGAIIGLFSGTIAMTGIMIPANLVITPLYLAVNRDIVWKLILPAIIPFNLLKGLISSVFALLVYKKISFLLNKTDYSFSVTHPQTPREQDRS